MTRLSGGAALKQAIHIARERAELTSDIQVAIKAGISYDTLMNWFGNKTTPRPAAQGGRGAGHPVRRPHGCVRGPGDGAAAAPGRDPGADRGASS